MKGNNLLTLTLAVLVMISAIAVVQVKHRNRELTTELDQLRVEHERLDMEWSQLQLEQATLAQHGRVDTLARTQFGMIEPPASSTVPAAAAPAAGVRP